MYRIDSSNNVPALPAKVAAESTPGYFNNAPGASPGTKVTGDWMNTVQEEIGAVVEGAGLVLNRANNAQLLAAIQGLVAGVMPTGFRGATTLPTAPAGWVLASGRTIGNAASGATERANADTQPLFTAYWTYRADLQLYNAGGAPIARGGSAAADWAANCRMALPDYRDREGVGKGDMGGTPANRITVAGGNFDTTVMGATGGAQNRVLTIANLPSAGRYDWAHGSDTPSTSGGSVHGADRDGSQLGTDTPVPILNPVVVENMIIKL